MHKVSKKRNIDIGKSNKQQEVADFVAVKKNIFPRSVLYSRGRKSQHFFTEDSKLYISPQQMELSRKGVLLDQKIGKWDSLSARVVEKFVRYQPSKSSFLLSAMEKHYAVFNETTEDLAKNIVGQFSMVRLWNASIVGSILFGMVMMTFVYRYLGQGASADITSSQQGVQTEAGQIVVSNTEYDAESFARQVMEIQKMDDQKLLEKEIKEMVKGYPIESMIPYIAQQDRTVAAFMIAIAKKESAWGKRVPVLNGQDCYNYWGYRGKRRLMGTGGHTCFNSPKDAVTTVAKRIETLVNEKGKDTPAKMVLWKCGSDCSVTGGQAAANKWISDVTTYFNMVNGVDDEEQEN